MKMVGKITCFVVLCMVLIAPHAEAVTCGQIQVGVVNCLPYLQNRGPLGGCCGAIKYLLTLCKTTQERRKSCGCVKTAANTIKGIDFGKAAGLSGVCGAKIPFEISPTVDCSKVQ
ncbi:non-specific lipid-transfer protein 2-like [Lycium barbarum]|uniref:non-specific lipid-transfer protein 2-like n=1 Tax=Lycium ferocissimum TaxID=112874 RepID=UPI00281654D6|nr:non-specific lipid-transfer protein 2-like [Lycium ferocissimum]XP_060176351.1 non-specific lipid-transfer protein 2-like [Lycium barbarum]